MSMTSISTLGTYAYLAINKGKKLPAPTDGTAKKSNHFTKKDFCFLKKTTNKNPDLEKTLSYCRLYVGG